MNIDPEHLRHIQSIVYAEVIREQLRGAAIIRYLWRAGSVCVSHWPTLVQKHNYLADEIHVQLFDFVVICHEIHAGHNIVCINFSPLWLLHCSSTLSAALRQVGCSRQRRGHLWRLSGGY